MKDWILLIAIALFVTPVTKGQSTYPPHGLHQNSPSAYAFTNCRLVTKPGKVFEEGVLIIRNGMVENAGKKLKTPVDAQVIDLKGAYVYPGLIDVYSSYGISKLAPKPGGPKPPQYKGKNTGPNAWNDAVRPEHLASESLKQPGDAAKKWRKMGFTTVNSIPNDGIFRGEAALIQLGDGPLAENLLDPASLQCMSFSKGSSTQAYPSSQMGAIALIRQTYLDAAWYQEAIKTQRQRPNTPAFERNLSLQALSDCDPKAPVFFECRDL